MDIGVPARAINACRAAIYEYIAPSTNGTTNTRMSNARAAVNECPRTVNEWDNE